MLTQISDGLVNLGSKPLMVLPCRLFFLLQVTISDLLKEIREQVLQIIAGLAE